MCHRNWIGLFLLGTINNLPYVIVTSAANTIADSFGKKNLIGLVFGANVALSVVVKTINGAFMLKVPYGIRYVINTVLMLIGLFGVAFAPSFWFSLVCIVFVGASSAFGENVALGFLRLFPSKMVNAWSSGTGMAGVLGCVIYITFGCAVGAGGQNTEKLRHLTQYAFLLTSPAVAVYLFAYFLVIRVPAEKRNEEYGSHSNEEQEPILGGSHSVQADPPMVLPITPPETKLRRIWRCFKLVRWLSVNLCVVYLFEYVAQGCAAKVRPKDEYHIGCPELYAGLSLCYQAGVFVSRSSVQLVQIKRVDILSVLQFFNMVLWVIDVHYKFLPVWSLPALMIYVGLLGGASYVNIFYWLLNDPKYPDQDRELCINIAAIFITVGIISGTVFETLLFSTWLKDD
ncbi:battenin-like isoform X3 [Dreissena polymorpha]|uniref:battenin-like isoform X3 n=1 Tax=Dreissena polymorpha TaxID=45954 RepID=UPI002263E723|nr:battenin-like isoform X3 [Dreissena polymorpha]